jgi:thiamine-phosphate pyrophosphorylase
MNSRERLQAARLYVVSSDVPPPRAAEVLCRAIDGGADVVQLRSKQAAKGEILDAALTVSAYSRRAGALFIVNDHLDVAMAADADGVHLGQDDLPLAVVRRLWGPHPLVGRSTHSIDQALAGVEEGADYLGVGPVHATPTKPGRPAVGTELVRLAAERVSIPWFAIGGLQRDNLDEVLAAGATRIAVVRAVCDAPDPTAAARELVQTLHAGAVV